MKHLKMFEDFNMSLTLFKVGDFVYSREKLGVKPEGVKSELEIIEKFIDKFDNVRYVVRGYDEELKKYREFYLYDFQIERKLTPEELEKLELEKNIEKYNL